ncbi:hypothetical protein WDZ92_20315 [Nostoc sp. NIES-2111]
MSNRLTVLKADPAPIRDYADLIQALRARKAELGLTNVQLDALSGLQEGYSGKLMADAGKRCWRALGPVSLPLMLSGLRCHLILIADNDGAPRGDVLDVKALLARLSVKEADHVG